MCTLSVLCFSINSYYIPGHAVKWLFFIALSGVKVTGMKYATCKKVAKPCFLLFSEYHSKLVLLWRYSVIFLTFFDSIVIIV